MPALSSPGACKVPASLAVGTPGAKAKAEQGKVTSAKQAGHKAKLQGNGPREAKHGKATHSKPSSEQQNKATPSKVKRVRFLPGLYTRPGAQAPLPTHGGENHRGQG